MEHNLNTLKKMKSVLDRPEFPGSPLEVKAYVAASCRATVEFNAPGTSNNSVITKYRSKLPTFCLLIFKLSGGFLVEWSKSSSFERIEGSQIVYDMKETSITISNLEHGECYTFRIFAGSMFGYGEAVVALPKNLRISSNFAFFSHIYWYSDMFQVGKIVREFSPNALYQCDPWLNCMKRLKSIGNPLSGKWSFQVMENRL